MCPSAVAPASRYTMRRLRKGNGSLMCQGRHAIRRRSPVVENESVVVSSV
jgi:hypothetical protein